MSQENQQIARRSFSTRSLLLIVLIVGLSVGGIAYGVGNALAANNTLGGSNQQGFYPKTGWPQRWNPGGSSTGFRAISTVNNVTVTGFNIADSTHFTLNLSYGGAGTAPAITIVGVAPGLSGSNTLSAGWGVSTTVAVNLVGSGSLLSTRHVSVLVVPYTA